MEQLTVRPAGSKAGVREGQAHSQGPWFGENAGLDVQPVKSSVK